MPSARREAPPTTFISGLTAGGGVSALAAWTVLSWGSNPRLSIKLDRGETLRRSSSASFSAMCETTGDKPGGEGSTERGATVGDDVPVAVRVGGALPALP